MKTFLKIGLLLVSLGGFASSPEPAIYQYWFDNDESSRIKNTQVYSGQSNSLDVDASGLSEGGHALKFRMANKNNQWGPLMTRYFNIQGAPDNSSSKAVAYRVWINNDIIASGSVPNTSDFILNADMPDNPVLSIVDSRDFSYRVGEATISMAASGKFVCYFQMLSESNEWGIPMYSEFDHSVTTKLTVDSVPVPYDYTFSKPDNNNFKAYRFFNSNNSVLYIKASQDCSMGLYNVDNSSDSNLALLKKFDLKKGETTKYEDSNIIDKQLIAILYDCKKDVDNQDEDVFLRIMFDNNRLPKPVIKFDPQTWEVTFTCADQRAKIHYTLDGNIPDHESPVYENTPIKLDKYTKVKAIAAYGDLGDSLVAEATFDGQNMRVPIPQLEFAGGEDRNEFILTNGIEGVTTYYVIGNGDVYDEVVRKTFDGTPFVIEDGALLNAYSAKDKLTDSEVLSVTVRHSDYVTAAPKLRYADGYVIAEHDDEGALIRFTDENGQSLQTDSSNPRRVEVHYNSIVRAYAQSDGYAESKAQRIGHTDLPVISVDLFTVSISKKAAQKVYYTIDGTQPNEKSSLYEVPFVVAESCTVRAVAFEDNLIPAEGEPYSVGYVKCLTPEVASYDGRYLTLSAEGGTTIRYTVGENTTDLREGETYNGKIDVMGLNQIRAIAQRAGADDSEILTFNPEYYANETEVFTSKPGDLKEAFGWSPDLSEFSSLKVYGPLVGSSTADSGDYSFLRTFPSLKHLDLRSVTDQYIPDGALDAGNLLSIVLPEQMTGVGNNIFGDSNSTLCALEIPIVDLIPENLLMGLKNTNLLLYVRNASNASKAIANTNGLIKNVIAPEGIEGRITAENVTLTHALPFFAHKEFNAKKILFTRPFSKETQIGGYGSGWETLSVPFDVQSIESSGKVLRPFGDVETDKGECPFWLFRAADTEWEAETAILANAPYLIAMPNNPFYADEFVVKGDVVFSSNNVTIPVTPTKDEMTYSFGTGRYIVGNYSWIDKGVGVLALNESVEEYRNEEFQPGGIFISNARDVAPFEPYVLSNGAKAIPVFDRSAIDELISDYGTRIWSESCSICIRSSIAMKIRIYDMVGQFIRIVDVKAGETVRVQDITPGIYFVGSTKIMVKKQ